MFVLAGYSGKAKYIEFIEDEKVKIIFRDSISAFDGVKLDELDNKGGPLETIMEGGKE